VSARDIDTLEESFDLVAPKGDELIRTFYDNLFEAEPAVKPLVAEVDMERQRQASTDSNDGADDNRAP
jgi:hemoglobin-like flavoprotein